MSKNYTESEIKSLVLNQINGIKGLDAAFDSDDATEALDEAVRECGFEHPLNTDTDKDVKYNWLIQRMRRFYIGRLLERYILRFDAGDLKAQGIVKNLTDAINKMDDDFDKARSDEKTAHIFIDAEGLFGSDTVVVGPGFIDDRIGQPIEDRT